MRRTWRATGRALVVASLSVVALSSAAIALASAAAPAQPAEDSELSPQRLLIDGHFDAAWRHNPAGTAWFDTHGYRLHARNPGKFVAVRAPVVDLPKEFVLSGVFQKIGGPPG